MMIQLFVFERSEVSRGEQPGWGLPCLELGHILGDVRVKDLRMTLTLTLTLTHALYPVPHKTWAWQCERQ